MPYSAVALAAGGAQFPAQNRPDPDAARPAQPRVRYRRLGNPCIPRPRLWSWVPRGGAPPH